MIICGNRDQKKNKKQSVGLAVTDIQEFRVITVSSKRLFRFILPSEQIVGYQLTPCH